MIATPMSLSYKLLKMKSKIIYEEASVEKRKSEKAFQLIESYAPIVINFKLAKACALI